MRSVIIFLFIGVLAPGYLMLSDEQARDAGARKPSTLSRLGIDFGAAELGRFADLSLNESQKRAALKVVRDQKPKIEKLCGRMTSALKMSEFQSAEKEAKELELSSVLDEFKRIQVEIIDGLHAIVTAEQMVRLEAMKEREAQALRAKEVG